MKPLRAPDRAWAHARADADPATTDWVDPRLDGAAFSVGEDGRFFGVDRAATLPPPLVADHAEDPGPSLAEGVVRVMAPAEWAWAVRALLWTPVTPFAGLLVRRVEAAGIGPELHRGDPARLRVLAARLPGWLPQRGSVPAAARLHAAVTGEAVGPAVWTAADPPPAAVAQAELFAGHAGGWWDARRSAAPPALRVEGGFVRVAAGDGGVPLRAGDLLVAVDGASPLPAAFPRLLPPGASLRLTTAQDPA
jgi:hypothetical protein